MLSDPGSRFALDVQGLAKLKYSARQSPRQGLEQTAQQFESMLLQRMLESMRDAMPKSGLLESSSLETYTAMLDRQWAQTLSGRGIGLADMLVEQLTERGMVAAAGSDTGAATSLADPGVGQPRRIPASMAVDADQIAALNARRVAESAASSTTQAASSAAEQRLSLFERSAPPVAEAASGASATAIELSELPAHVGAFIAKLGSAARSVSDATGISSRLILAQAALETGWGGSEIKKSNGERSHNLFNIKATGGWQGERANVATTEFEQGQQIRMHDDFRVYDSYAQAFADYARLLTENPRYAGVVSAGTPEEAARQLQHSGYATDPDYADKLIRIMKQIPDTVADLAERMGDRLFSDATDRAPMLAAGHAEASQTSLQRQALDAYSIDHQPTRIF